MALLLLLGEEEIVRVRVKTERRIGNDYGQIICRQKRLSPLGRGAGGESRGLCSDTPHWSGNGVKTAAVLVAVTPEAMLFGR
ncbi:MAG TPA: hypothetical protein VKJ65_08375, partial [Phycisphaerae bacterium]|nr:hypothetical protein [Phycisphaerae bacterium]